MPTSARNSAQHHFTESEQALAFLGRLPEAGESDRIVEALTALTHAVLSIAATLTVPARHPSDPDFGRDY